MAFKRSNSGAKAPVIKPAELGRRNNILAALSGVELRRLISGAAAVDLTFGQVLYEAGKLQRYVYFPINGYVSQVACLSDIPRIEVGLVGAEGMVGSSLVFGIQVAPLHTVVQGSGDALRVDALEFCRELARGPALRAVMNRYLYVRMSQLGQMTACARFHSIQERLARWLLMTRDRARSDIFQMTHKYLAFMLGVRRVGITEAAMLLQKRNVIRYSRGELAILNGAELESASCECYVTAERLYSRHMI